MLITLDANRLNDKTQAHPYLKEKLSFPDYYGNNLDALYDCLTDLGPVTVRFVNEQEGGAYYERIRRVFEDASRANPDLKICSNDYTLIALDVDGTAVNDKKELSPRFAAAVERAFHAGKEVVFCTGRGLSEMYILYEKLPPMHYLIAESGGCIHDLYEGRILYSAQFDPAVIDAIEETVRGRDVMIYVYGGGKGYSKAEQLAKMDYYQMEDYVNLIPPVSVPEEDVFGAIRSGRITPGKINLFHTSPQEREISAERLIRAGLPATWAFSEKSTLECTPPGVHKGFGLKKLSELTGIPLEDMIMVGDAWNDLEGIRMAGLGIAVENAGREARKAADVVVADNNHDGAAQAIERFLLNE